MQQPPSFVTSSTTPSGFVAGVGKFPFSFSFFVSFSISVFSSSFASTSFSIFFPAVLATLALVSIPSRSNSSPTASTTPASSISPSLPTSSATQSFSSVHRCSSWASVKLTPSLLLANVGGNLASIFSPCAERRRCENELSGII